MAAFAELYFAHSCYVWEGWTVLQTAVWEDHTEHCEFSHVRLFSTPWTAACRLPVHHQLWELAQTHVHSVGDAIQPSYPLSSPSPAFSLSQHQGLFLCQFFAAGAQSIGASASASFLPMNIQDWFLLGLTGLLSLQSKGLSRVFSNTTVQKHQFFGTQLSL